MDDTTKTILGMLSAFIIAFMSSFLAEPVKAWFERRQKSEKLRLALYIEMYRNYEYLIDVINHTEPGERELIILSNLRFDCYKNAIMHEFYEFYNLNDSITINKLYKIFHILSNFSNDPYIDRDDWAEVFTRNFRNEVKSNGIHRNILKQFISDNELKELLTVEK